MTRKAPSFLRRTFLRGAGVCLALPYLESLGGRRAGAQPIAAPRRMLAVYFPNGAAASYWTPSGAGTGDNWALSPVLAPLAPLKHKTTVFTNLENYSTMQGDQFVEPSHARCTGAFLTCVDSDAVSDELGRPGSNGISVDQVIAQSQIGMSSPLPSMQLGLSTLNSYTDGRDGALSRSVSWSSATNPLYKDVNPQSVFDRLVSSGATDGPVDEEAQAAAERRRLLRKSALDYLGESTTRLQGRLSSADRQHLDQYLTSVRELERRVDAIGGNMGGTAMCAVGDRPPQPYAVENTPDGYDRGAHADVMNDLIVMAFQCDSTRVVSHMLDDARTDFVYNHLTNRVFTADGSTPGSGAVGGYHGLQHAGDSNDGYATINWWFTQKVLELCQRLDAIPEGDGTMLDNTVVLYGSGMHGSNHDANELPIAMVGGGSVFRTDQHIVFPETPSDRPLRDLYVTMLQRFFGLDVPNFGTSVKGAQPSLIEEIL